MKNNIFEGAKFGDKFLTRDNKIALYYEKGTNDYHLLIPESYGSFVAYHSDGREIDNEEHDIDIVSRYQEGIIMTKQEWLQICRLHMEWYYVQTVFEGNLLSKENKKWIEEHMPSEDIFDDGRIEFFQENFKPKEND